eukprot:scaffold4372_cov397-Prasinococcus_capsulatus_cf.AAC.27
MRAPAKRSAVATEAACAACESNLRWSKTSSASISSRSASPSSEIGECCRTFASSRRWRGAASALEYTTGLGLISSMLARPPTRLACTGLLGPRASLPPPCRPRGAYVRETRTRAKGAEACRAGHRTPHVVRHRHAVGAAAATGQAGGRARAAHREACPRPQRRRRRRHGRESHNACAHMYLTAASNDQWPPLLSRRVPTDHQVAWGTHTLGAATPPWMLHRTAGRSFLRPRSAPPLCGRRARAATGTGGAARWVAGAGRACCCSSRRRRRRRRCCYGYVVRPCVQRRWRGPPYKAAAGPRSPRHSASCRVAVRSEWGREGACGAPPTPTRHALQRMT